MKAIISLPQKAYDALRGRLFLNEYGNVLARELRDCKRILDVGCGPRSCVRRIAPQCYSLGIDRWMQSVRESRSKEIHTDYCIADVVHLCVKSRSFDCVLAVDLLEHLSKDAGLKFLGDVERIANKKVVIITPNGFVDTNCPEILDKYGGNPLNIHRSGWGVEELENLGYRCAGISGLKYMQYGDNQIRWRPKLFWMIVVDLSKWPVRYFPKAAFQIVAVKDLQGKQ
jgi:hypothetical protein